MTSYESHRRDSKDRRQFSNGLLPPTERALLNKIRQTADNDDLSPEVKFREFTRITRELLNHRSLVGPAVLATLAYQSARILSAVDINQRQSLRTQHLDNPGSFIREIALASRKGIALFNAREVSNVAWAFAKMEIKDEQLFGALAKKAKESMWQFTSQGISNTAWAFATLEIQDKGLFAALAQRACKVLDEFRPQEASNTAWAFATLEIKDEALFRALSQRARELVEHFNAQDISNTAWAFATIGILDEALFRALSQRARESLGQFNSQNVANTAWAFATLGIRDEALFRALSQRAQGSLGQFNSQDIANTAWAFATLGIKDEQLFRALFQRARESAGQFDAQGIANSAWAFAVATPSLISTVVSRNTLSTLHKPQEWLQVYHALLVAKVIEPSEKFEMLEAITSGYQKQELNTFEAAVYEWLQNVCGFSAHEIESHRVIAGIATDFVITRGDRRIVVECDGDRHHLSTGPDGGQPLGRDSIQDSIFTICGYEVVHIRDSQFATPRGQLAVAQRLVRTQGSNS
jgi:hypothetical protein